MIDPRDAVFQKRLRPVGRIIAVGGGKGGVGKTTIACLGALGVAASGRRAGLLDLDIHGGAAHLMLSIVPRFPEEEGGILPLAGPKGVLFMSAAAFSGDRPLALRGAQVSDAIRELLAVTIWPELDVLFIDMPPGLGESLLELFRFIPRAEIVAVSTPSAPSLAVADRFLSAVSRRATIAGIVGNMIGDEGATGVRGLASKYSTDLLALVPVDRGLERAFGFPDRLLETESARALGSWQPVQAG